MVHDQTDTFLMGILVEGRKIEVRIRCDEIKYKILLTTIPVFPTFVPSLDEKGIEAIGSCEVDIATHILIVGPMTTMRLRVCIVCLTQLHRGIITGVRPMTLTCNHLPPYTHIFHGMDPGGVFNHTRIVKVQHQS